jgi:hypothetical protein
MNTDCVTVSTVVAVDPGTAFSVFTEDIAGWWKPKVHGLFQAGRTGTLQFREGRLWEIYGNSEPFEIGRVTAWEPGVRLAVEWRQEGFSTGDHTAVEVRFEPVARGTRVTVAHSGWDAVRPAARYGASGEAFLSLIGLRWADALTSLRHAAR